MANPHPSISLVVAMDEADTIGRDGGLPWRLPADLRHFRRLTLGKTVLMGRKTWDSLGKPLDGRRNWVLSRDPAFRPAGAEAFTTLDRALDAHGPGELMVIGGAELYRQTLERARTVYLTRVHARVDGDTRFPPWSPAAFRETAAEHHAADERHAHAYSFITLERT